jgi:predicted kinase
MSMMELILFIGIQAVGKSTFYQQRFFNTHIRINLDMLKTRHREQILVNACLAAKQPFVIDNTNVTRNERARYIVLAEAAGFRVVGFYFQSTIRDALERNRQRSGRQLIPEKGIAGTHKRLQLPELDEGFDELYYVSINDAQDFVIQEWNHEL